jgi:uncharacterized protein (TIGR01777 family)
VTIDRFVRETPIPVARDRLWAWHSRPGAFERLAPPWQRIELLDAGQGVAEGSRALLQLSKAGIPLRWLAEHHDVRPPSGFEDTQVKGPFSTWTHRHRFEQRADESLLRDEIDYALPGGSLARLLAGSSVRRDLERTFRYRHDITRADLELHERFADRPPLRVAVSGSSGLIGSTLCAMLTTGGHEVVRLVRRSAETDAEAQWDPDLGAVDLDRLEELDGIVHLAGENIAGGRWTNRRMQRIRDSRVRGTSALVTSLGQLRHPPSVVVSASAIGIYGDRGAEELTETSRVGEGFLADVGSAWESAALGGDFPARRVLARFGVVLSPRGGALAKMLPAFRLGLGGRLGAGDQYTSWISIDDAAAALVTALCDDRLEGPVNLTAPTPVTNRQLTVALSRALGRPAVIPAPASVLRALLGKMADEALLSSGRVLPRSLQSIAFEFRHPTIVSALEHLLGRRAAPAD